MKQITGVPSSLFLLNAATPKYSWANCSRGKHEPGSSLIACATDLTSPPAQNATFPSAPACVLCKSTALAGRLAASAIPPGKCLSVLVSVTNRHTHHILFLVFDRPSTVMILRYAVCLHTHYHKTMPNQCTLHTKSRQSLACRRNSTNDSGLVSFPSNPHVDTPFHCKKQVLSLELIIPIIMTITLPTSKPNIKLNHQQLFETNKCDNPFPQISVTWDIWPWLDCRHSNFQPGPGWWDESCPWLPRGLWGI